eukprot:3933238-Rhodomonas_salina.11
MACAQDNDGCSSECVIEEYMMFLDVSTPYRRVEQPRDAIRTPSARRHPLALRYCPPLLSSYVFPMQCPALASCVPCYPFAIRCSVLKYAMPSVDVHDPSVDVHDCTCIWFEISTVVLSACYAMSGTDLVHCCYQAATTRYPSAKPSVFGAQVLWAYTRAMRCPVRLSSTQCAVMPYVAMRRLVQIRSDVRYGHSACCHTTYACPMPCTRMSVGCRHSISHSLCSVWPQPRLSSYAFAMRFPILRLRMLLPACPLDKQVAWDAELELTVRYPPTPQFSVQIVPGMRFLVFELVVYATPMRCPVLK